MTGYSARTRTRHLRSGLLFDFLHLTFSEMANTRRGIIGLYMNRHRPDNFTDIPVQIRGTIRGTIRGDGLAAADHRHAGPNFRPLR